MIVPSRFRHISSGFNLLRLPADPNQITSVFFGFSCSRLELQFVSTSMTVSVSVLVVALMHDGLELTSACMSSAKPCKLTLCLEKMDAISSIYEMNCRGPRTEPCGTPHTIGRALDAEDPKSTICDRSVR